jgi:hypothetical protein
MQILSSCLGQDAIFLGDFAGSFSKSGKYVVGTFLFESRNRTLVRSSVWFLREKCMEGVDALSSLTFACDGVGLSMAVFPDGAIKKGPAGRSFVERKKGLQAPSDTWSFRLVLVPGWLRFLDPAVFRLPEFGV